MHKGVFILSMNENNLTTDIICGTIVLLEKGSMFLLLPKLEQLIFLFFKLFSEISRISFSIHIDVGRKQVIICLCLLFFSPLLWQSKYVAYVS